MVHLPTENRQDQGHRGESYGKGLSFPAHSFQHTPSDPVPGCPRSGATRTPPFSGRNTEGASAAAAASLQSCPTLCDPIDGSPPGSRPWDSPGKNTGVGCHFLLQCIKVKRESEVTQSCPTLSDPMECSLPGSSIHGIFQTRVLEWGVIAFSIQGVSVF